jgi:hypothetical protein
MHFTERAFITGLILYYKPIKILELGVAAGSGSAVILNAIKGIENAHLHSVDFCERYYRDKTKSTGYIVDEYFPCFVKKRTMYLGEDVANIIDTIGSEIDFFVLDTVHVHPVEMINFLCVLPYLKENSIVVLHDISLYLTKSGFSSSSYACKLLFDTIVAYKITPKEKYLTNPNIGAFQINVDTKRYIYNLFSCLFLPWGKYIIYRMKN